MEKKEDKKKPMKLGKLEKQVLWLFVALVIVVLISIAVYFLMKPEPTYFEYGPFKIYKKNLEGTTLEKYYVPFKTSDGRLNQLPLRNDPRELGNVSLNLSNEAWRSISMVWVSSDPNVTYAPIPAVEIGRFFIINGLNTSYAFSKDGKGYTEMNCGNATKNIRVIDIRVGNETRVYSEGYCIIIEGKEYLEMTRAADKLAITWLERIAVSKPTQ